MLNPGRYYVGDLCYVLSDMEWSELCALMDSEDLTYHTEFTLSNGLKVGITNTYYGDGTYEDQDGRTYDVDSGTLGCVEWREEWDKQYPHNVHVFEKSFQIKYYDGTIEFGDVVWINTDSEPENEYDETDRYDGYEEDDSWHDDYCEPDEYEK